MLDEAILQLGPTLLAVARLLVENVECIQLGPVHGAECIEVDQFLAHEEPQQFFVDGQFLKQLVLGEIVHHIDLFVVVRCKDAVQHSVNHHFLPPFGFLCNQLRVHHGQIVA
uniref:Putative secreted protein n=1 Tax=Anopheles darlingi TaxID=43151 RepID=A0A2M4D2S5_ANODA